MKSPGAIRADGEADARPRRDLTASLASVLDPEVGGHQVAQVLKE
jgi:hypothetical protein